MPCSTATFATIVMHEVVFSSSEATFEGRFSLGLQRLICVWGNSSSILLFSKCIFKLALLVFEVHTASFAIVFLCQMAPEQGLQFVIQPQAIRNKCLEEARQLMQRCSPVAGSTSPSASAPAASSSSSLPSPSSSSLAPKVLDLVAQLTSLMLQVKVSASPLVVLTCHSS